MRKTSLVFCCTLICFSSGLYGDNSKSKELKELRKQARKYHFKEGSINYDEALAKYEVLAESGDYYGYTAQAAIYASSHGESHPKDYAKAKKLYKKAMAKGEPVSFNGLGRMYLYGLGVDQDFAKAEELLKEASLRGRYDADLQLGHMYHHGLGKEIDFSQAAAHYQESICRGSKYAHYSLAKLYFLGQEDVFEADIDLAFEHLSKAVDMGVKASYVDLAKMYMDGAVDYDVEKAIELLQKGAAQGRGRAYFFLGQIYHKGQGTEPNFQMAYDYYTQAVEYGYARSYIAMSRLYQEGQTGNFPCDLTKTIECLELGIAAEQNQAYVDLAKLYLKGKGVEQDVDEGLRLLKKAGEEGYANAYYHLSQIYDKGKWVDYDPELSLEYLKKGINGKDKSSFYKLGSAYLNGCYGKDNELELSGKSSKGLKYLKFAAKRGHTLSQLALALYYAEDLSDDSNRRKARKFYNLAVSSQKSQAKVDRAIEKGVYDASAVNNLKLL